MGAISFALPWGLVALAFLPVLWFLLRLTPPAPKTAIFPPIRFLFGLQGRENTAARTPWWMLILRLLLATMIILAASHPVLNAVHVTQGQQLLLVIDDDWAAARFWQGRQQELSQILGRAERAGSPVIVMSSAPPANGEPVAMGSETTAVEARKKVQGLTPKPWPADRAALVRLLEGGPLSDKPVRVIWLSNGLDDEHAERLGELLRRYGGGLEVLTDPGPGLPHWLVTPRTDAKGLSVDVHRAWSQEGEALRVRALDGRGQVLAYAGVSFGAGQKNATASFSLAGEIRNRVERLDIENEATAAAVVLLDDHWKRRPVGIAEVGGESSIPLLDDTYYIERALTPFADVGRGGIRTLLAGDLSILFLGDGGTVAQDDLAALTDWIDKGGVLVRFSGPRLVGTDRAETGAGPIGEESLLPVRLHGGSRVLGGAMSWTAPAGLAPFPENSPFSGLPVEGVQVFKQVLAEPSVDLNEKTWARLSDGTPLVTAARRGDGWTVLFHTTAGPEWSDLALSGLFVDMLRRLLDLSQGIAGGDDSLPLAVREALDGFGRLSPPPPAARAVSAADLVTAKPGPATPPGYYESASVRHAFNLGLHVPDAVPLHLGRGVDVRHYGGLSAERDLQPWLLGAALVLALIDTCVSLLLRGAFRGRRRGSLTLAVLIALGSVGMGVPDARAASREDAFVLRVTERPPLAYVMSGDPGVDAISRAGLKGLALILERRTTAVMGDPVGIDPEQDPVIFYPCLYWPVSAGQTPLSAAARDRINDYLRRGGMILFDTGAVGGFSSPPPQGDASLARLTAGLEIPALAPVDESHVLRRSFYLLREMPGRFAETSVWAASEEITSNDGVSPVIVGDGGWAAAWAVDGRGQPMMAVVPGGEYQREIAYRFGVNWVMYALTGNYKADQVHAPAILERLGQ